MRASSRAYGRACEPSQAESDVVGRDLRRALFARAAAAPERDRVGETTALLGRLVGVEIRMIALQEAAPGGGEFDMRRLRRETEEAEQPLRLARGLAGGLALGTRRA